MDENQTKIAIFFSQSQVIMMQELTADIFRPMSQKSAHKFSHDKDHKRSAAIASILLLRKMKLNERGSDKSAHLESCTQRMNSLGLTF